MKKNDGALGDVDMFGLDEFGEPVGGDAMWGSVIGGGIGTGISVITRAASRTSSPNLFKYSEAVGMLGGMAAGGLMMIWPSTRRMGLAALATAAVTNGLRQLETSLFAPSTTAAAPAAAAAPAGWGGVVIDPTAVIQPGGGFGIHTIEPGYAVHGGGFGAPVIDRAYPIPGSIHSGGGFAGSRPELVGPPTLVGAGDYGMGENPAVKQAALLGGPSVSALGAHYGATLFGHSQ